MNPLIRLYKRRSDVLRRCGVLPHLDHAGEHRLEVAPQVGRAAARVGSIDGDEGDGIAGAPLAELMQVGADNRGDLWIAPGSLAVRKEDQRSAVTGNLDASGDDPVGDDVEAAPVLDGGPSSWQPIRSALADMA